MKRWCKIAAAATMTLGLGACAPTFAGRLLTEDGEPIGANDARVNITNLTPLEQPVSILSPVDGSGAFAARGLPPGEYLVEAIVPGFAVASQQIVVKGDPVVLDLRLKQLAAAAPTAIGVGAGGDGRGAGGAVLAPPSF
jgi:hypothetical protein